MKNIETCTHSTNPSQLSLDSQVEQLIHYNNLLIQHINQQTHSICDLTSKLTLQRQQQELAQILSQSKRMMLESSQCLHNPFSKENTELNEKLVRLNKALENHLYSSHQIIQEILGVKQLKKQAEQQKCMISVLSQEIQASSNKATSHRKGLEELSATIEQMQVQYQQREDYKISSDDSQQIEELQLLVIEMKAEIKRLKDLNLSKCNKQPQYSIDSSTTSEQPMDETLQSFTEYVPKDQQTRFQVLFGDCIAKKEEIKRLKTRLKDLEEGNGGDDQESEHVKIIEEYKEIVSQLRVEHRQLININAALQNELQHFRQTQLNH